MRFDHCAHTYDDHAAPQRAFAERVFEFLEAPPGDQILELGAGTGALTKRLITGARVVATDVSEAMVKLGQLAVPQADWRQLDAFAQALPSSPLQVSSGLLQWAPRPETVLRKWARALQPGGRMIHAFPCEPCLREWRALVPGGPVQWRPESEWLEIFQQAGLWVKRRRVWVEPHVFRSALDLVRAWHASGVTGQARVGPGELRRAIRHYDARHRVAEGVTSTWAWMALEAVAGT